MNRSLLCIAVVSTLVLGCGHASTSFPKSSSSAKLEKAQNSVTAQKDPPFDPPMGPDEIVPIASLMPAKVAEVPLRAPGDFVVHRFSGSFRDTPLTLTQRVVARNGNVLVVDMTFEEGSSKKTLRVKMDDAEATRGEVLGVAVVDAHGRETAAPVSLFEEMMEKTAVSADQNEEELGSENLTVDIAGNVVGAKKTSYRVRLGKIQATMRTVHSDVFAWGDVSGEITSQSGDVIYRAELVESGHADVKALSQPVAKSDESDDLYDDE